MKTFVKIFIFILSVSGQLTAQEPNNKKVVNKLSDCKNYYFQGKYKEAILLYYGQDERLSAEEDYFVGLSYSSMYVYDEAVKYLNEAVVKNNSENGYKYQLAKIYLLTGKNELAGKLFTDILSIDPKNSAVLFDAAALDYDFGKPESAINKYKKVISINPSNFLAYYNIANVYSKLEPSKKYADSTSVFLEACAGVNPDYLPGIEMLATLKYNNNKIDDALRLFLIAASKNKTRADYKFYAGACYMQQKEYEKAAAYYNQAIALNQNSAHYWGNLAFVQFNLNKMDSAILSYKKAIELDPNNSLMLLNLAFAYEKADSSNMAISMFKSAIEKMHPEVIEQAEMQIAAIYYLKMMYKDAIKEYERIISNNPNNEEAKYFLASSEDKLGNYSKASEDYKKYIILSRNMAVDESKLKEDKKYVFAKRRIAELSKNIKKVKK